MRELVAAFLEYPFLSRAFAAGVMVALAAALLGVCLVLKNYSLIGDGLSHIGFGSLAIAGALNLAPLPVALPCVVAAAFLLLRGRRSGIIGGDGAIAAMSTTALAAGVIAASLSGANTDLSAYMFGSILSISRADAALCAALCGVTAAFFVIFKNRIFSVTFDEDFARATGIKAGVYESAFAVLTAATVSLGMRLVGTLLISSLIVFPAISAMRVFHRFAGVTAAAAAIAVVCVTAGLAASYSFGLPAGASVAAANAAAFGVSALFGAVTKRRRAG